jgi:hypothetical protein
VDVRKHTYGAGLHNPSMACYVNSTMQVMLHTPPLLSEAYAHGKIADCECPRCASAFTWPGDPRAELQC